MEFEKLGQSGVEISRLSLGTWAFAGGKVWGDSDTAASIQTIHSALDHGINLIDTAESYGDGRSEEIVGQAIHDRRSDVVLSTKVYTNALHYEDVITHCDASLKRLRTDYIDLYQVHWPNPEIAIEETYGAFEDLKKAGKIRFSGICNAGKTSLGALKAEYGVAMNQLPYSLIWRIAEKEIIPATVKSGMGVWAYSPLAQGLLTGKFRSVKDVPIGRRETRFYSGHWTEARHSELGFETEIFAFINALCTRCEQNGYTPAQVAMSFLKQKKEVCSILVGARSTAQLVSNMQAFDTVVAKDFMQDITTLSNRLKEIMGDNADMWVGNGGRFF